MNEVGRRIAGVMGGMGPDATIDFMARVSAMSESGRDQDHVHLIVDQDPSVPNRQEAIRTGIDDVSPYLAEMARKLENAGADFLVMVCNTAHVFLDGVRQSTSIPFISIIDESIAEVGRVCPDAKGVGILATDGCLNTNIYQDAVAATNRSPIVPDADGVTELMRLITAIKAGDTSRVIADGMEAVAQELVERGADIIIGGCTEIPLVFEGTGFSVPFISSTNVLARKTLALAQGREPLPGELNQQE